MIKHWRGYALVLFLLQLAPVSTREHASTVVIRDYTAYAQIKSVYAGFFFLCLTCAQTQLKRLREHMRRDTAYIKGSCKNELTGQIRAI